MRQCPFRNVFLQTVALSTLFLGMLCPEVSANPLDSFGFGARGLSLGNAMTAIVDDTTSNYYNPSGLVRSGDLKIDVGYYYNHFSLKLNNRPQNISTNSGLQAGIQIPFDIGPVRLGFGIALFLPNERVSRVRALPQFQPRFVLYDNRTQRIFITANFAIRPIKWLYIGGGVTFLTNTQGGLYIDGFVTYPDAAKSHLYTEVDVDLRTIRYPSFGIQVTPLDWLSIGLVYRGEVSLVMDLKTQILGYIADETDGSKIVDGQFLMDSHNTNLFSPQQVVLGIAFNISEHFLLTLDVGWYDWSAYPPETAEVDLTLELGIFPSVLPPPTIVEPPTFHDTVVPRLGVEYTSPLTSWLDITIRGGYVFEPTPAPEQRGETNYVDGNRHVFSFGLGFDFKNYSSIMIKPISIDLAVQYFYFPKRDHNKANPTDIIGDYTSSGNIIGFGVTSRFRF